MPAEDDGAAKSRGILNIIAVIAQSWPVIVALPLLAGVITFLSISPGPAYVASASVPVPFQEILNAVGESEPGEAFVTGSGNATLIRLPGETAEEAAAKVRAVLSQLAATPAVTGARRAANESLIKAKTQEIAQLENTLATIQETFRALPPRSMETNQVEVLPYVNATTLLISEIATKQQQVSAAADELSRVLVPSPDRVYVRSQKSASKVRGPVTVAIILTGLATLLVIFLRDAVRNLDHAGAEDIRKIRRAFFLGGRKTP